MHNFLQVFKVLSIWCATFCSENWHTCYSCPGKHFLQFCFSIFKLCFWVSHLYGQTNKDMERL